MWTSRILLARFRYQASLARACLRCCNTLARSAACSSALHLRKPSPDLKPSLPSATSCFEIGRRPGPALDIGQHGLVDRQRQIGADQIGVLQRPEHREPPAEARLDHGVDGLGVADAVLDQRDRLAPQRMLQPVADEARHVLLHVHRHLARCACAARWSSRSPPARSTACRSPRPAAPDRAGSTNGCRARARGRAGLP